MRVLSVTNYDSAGASLSPVFVSMGGALLLLLTSALMRQFAGL